MNEIESWGIPTVNTHGHQTIRDTFAILNGCTQVVAGDTLVMHGGCASKTHLCIYWSNIRC